MPEKKRTVRQALPDAAAALADSGITDALSEAEYLLTHLLGCKRAALFLDPDRVLSDDELKRFEGFLERRKRREPSQYITGEVDFRGHRIKVTRATLIPRPETELLVEEAVKEAATLAKAAVILDLCTGSGCVAVSAALEIKGSKVYATDISGAALSVARENAGLNGATPSIEFYGGDLFGALPAGLENSFDMILSNPPYVAEGDRAGLAPEVRDFEPGTALFAGEDGLDVIRRIIEGAPGYLKEGGVLIMEIGWGQAEVVKRLIMEDGRYSEAAVRKDYSGIERIHVARVRR